MNAGEIIEAQGNYEFKELTEEKHSPRPHRWKTFWELSAQDNWVVAAWSRGRKWENGIERWFSNVLQRPVASVSPQTY